MSRLFGAVRQNGYVVRDIRAAMRHWSEVAGVGPWFFAERAPIRDFRYRGEPSSVELSIALANSGDLQLELIEQRNDAPSLYRDFLEAGQEGLQHIAYWTTDFVAHRARALERGLRIGHEGQTGEWGPFVYFDAGRGPGAHPGSVIELSDVGGAKARLFARIAEAARGWDGKDPVRPFSAAG